MTNPLRKRFPGPGQSRFAVVVYHQNKRSKVVWLVNKRNSLNLSSKTYCKSASVPSWGTQWLCIRLCYRHLRRKVLLKISRKMSNWRHLSTLNSSLTSQLSAGMIWFTTTSFLGVLLYYNTWNWLCHKLFKINTKL